MHEGRDVGRLRRIGPAGRLAEHDLLQPQDERAATWEPSYRAPAFKNMAAG